MPRLTAMDELLVHQIPEPLPNVVTHHPHWRESHFFIAHRSDALGAEPVPLVDFARVAGTLPS